jgi:muconolactone delta-isomerase
MARDRTIVRETKPRTTAQTICRLLMWSEEVMRPKFLQDMWFLLLLWRCAPMWAMVFTVYRFLDHAQRRTTVGRTPLDEWSSSSQKPLADNAQQSQQANIHAIGGNRKHNIGRRAATDLHLRQRGHWDRRKLYDYVEKNEHICIQIRTSVSSNRLCKRGHTE